MNKAPRNRSASNFLDPRGKGRYARGPGGDFKKQPDKTYKFNSLPRPWPVTMIPFGKRPKKLPAVLGANEVDQLLQCVTCLKHRTLLLTLYAAGLRLSEGASLTISDIDSQRMLLRIARGKGQKERLVPLSPRLLTALREYWKVVRSPKYLFPGSTFETRISSTTIQKSWNQKLEPHAHVHALVPGGGPALSGARRWVTSRRPHVRQCDGRYLVDADVLRRRFRETFLKGLKQRHRQNQLKLEGDWAPLQDRAAFDAWLEPLETITWVAYIEPPPTERSSPEQVLKYLARYLTGGPISDRRLISHEHGQVTFRARAGHKTGGDARDFEPVTLTGPEFVRRWSLHILPKGYVKTRRCGGYSNHHCERYLTECQTLLRAAGISPLATESLVESPDPAAVSDADSTDPCCPTCGAVLRCIATQRRGNWFLLMNGPLRPSWYDDG